MPNFPALCLDSLIRLRQTPSLHKALTMFYFTPPLIHSCSPPPPPSLTPALILHTGWFMDAMPFKAEGKKSPTQLAVLFLGVCTVVLGQRHMGGGEEAMLIRWRLGRKIPFESVLKAFSSLLNHCMLLSQAHHPWKPPANRSVSPYVCTQDLGFSPSPTEFCVTFFPLPALTNSICTG